MKKFVIRSTISFLVLFIFVSAISYLFYGYIVSGYIDKEVEDVVYYNSKSTLNLVSRKFTLVNEEIHNFYEKNKELDLHELNESAKVDSAIKDLNVTFGVISPDNLVTENVTHTFNVFYAGTPIINNNIYFLNYDEVFLTSEYDDINIIFNLGDKVAIVESNLFFEKILWNLDKNDENDEIYNFKSFIISGDGHIYYKTEEKNAYTNFYELYIHDLSTQYTKKDFIDDVVNGKSKVVSDFNYLGEKSFIYFAPLGQSEQQTNFYFINVFYEDTLIHIKDDLVLPLVVMFVVLISVLLLGIITLYAIALRKSSDIEASKAAMYYSKPYILKINNKGKIVYKNQAFKKLGFDWKKYENIYFFEQVGEDPDILASIKKRKALTLKLVNEASQSFTFYMVPIKIGISLYLLGQEVTNRFNEITELIHEVTYDPKTNLPNKKILLKDLNAHLQTIKTQNLNNNIINSSLIMLNIQRLNRFTNIFGSKTTDKLVLNFIEIIKDLMSEKEKLYRIDKDKFVILFKKIEKYEDVIAWIENLMVVLRKPLSIDENQLMILIKCGIFNIELNMYEDLDENQIFDYTEIAFNHANGLSSVDYMVYNISLGRLIKKEQLMEEDLKVAIEKDEFIVYVQPQYNTNKNMIVGFEALTRWNNPKYLTDSPQHFIEMAEKNNMIVPIGRIITDQAFKIAKSLEKYHIEISINVSPAQMMQDGFVSQIIGICEKYEVDPETIALEITETFLVENFKIVNEKLAVLKKYGFKIHLDDFGTGYSSLLYLKDLPIDAIKIDMEFTKYLNTDKSTRAIVSKVISLASSLNLDIIAEGVEDEKQSLFLNKSGCEIIQGWLIGKAMPVTDAIKLLEAYNVKKTKTLEMEPKAKKTRTRKTKKEGDK